ncbi:hypothetical protein RCL1_001504 [Eukaryota sp. TZLM3-RCL]
MPTATATSTSNVITLKGSTEIVTEFFNYAINSVLYQRGVYPSNLFKPEKKYGLTLLQSSDPALQDYLSQILSQVRTWLLTGNVRKLVVVLSSVIDDSPLERWVFDIEKDDSDPSSDGSSVQKSEKQIQSEIQAILRQITASVTFLPLIDDPVTFELLCYTSNDTEIPSLWQESNPKLINSAQEVKLRSFSTSVHRIGAEVSFRGEV